MMNDDLVRFEVIGDLRGNLIALEESKNVPFDVKRVFYIFNVSGENSRGNHSHYRTKQLLIAICGRCKVTLDDGKVKKTYTLDKINEGLFQDSLVWGSMHDFSEDCILMVIASSYYDESDYIRNYSEFIKVVNK